MIRHVEFPKARLEALADYYEHMANRWIVWGEGSRSGLALQAETMGHAQILRQAIAAYSLSQEQLRLLGEGLRPGAVIEHAPLPLPPEDAVSEWDDPSEILEEEEEIDERWKDEVSDQFPRWVNPPGESPPPPE